jgi:hypothetical protein
VHSDGVPHTVGKLSTRATTFFQTSSQLEIFTQSYVPQKSRKSQLWEFQDSLLGILGQNDIWVLVPWLGTEYTIRGRWWLPPSSGRGESYESVFARGYAPKCSNYALTNLLFGLCRSMWVIEFLFNLPSPIQELEHAPLIPKCCKPRSTPQLLFLRCLHLWTCSWIHQITWGCVRDSLIENLKNNLLRIYWRIIIVRNFYLNVQIQYWWRPIIWVWLDMA